LFFKVDNINNMENIAAEKKYGLFVVGRVAASHACCDMSLLRVRCRSASR